MKALVHERSGESREYFGVEALTLTDKSILFMDVAGLHIFPLEGTTVHLAPESEGDFAKMRSFIGDL